MASPSPENEIPDQVEDVKPDSEDETWLKVGLTRKEKYLSENMGPTEEGGTVDNDIPLYNDVNNMDEAEVEAAQDIMEVERNDETETVHVQSDESDDVSVITESEAEQNAESQICNNSFHTENPDYNVLTTWRFQPSVFSNTRSIINTVLLCSVGVLFGLAIPHFFSMTPNVCPISSDMDLHTIRAENNKLIDHMKELIEVKSILNQIKATIPQTSEEQKEKASFKKQGFKKPVVDATLDSGPIVLKQLQISLTAVSGALTQVNNVNDLHKESIIDSQNIINDLIEIQRIMSGLVKHMKDLDRPVEAMFWQIANDSIINFSQSLLRRLSNVLLDMTANINIKLNKVKCALNKKICHLRNTLPEEEQFFMQMEGIHKFIEHCDTIVNIRCKSHENLKKHKAVKKKDAKVKVKEQKANISIDESKSPNIPESTEKQDDIFTKCSQEKVVPKVNNFKEFLSESLDSENTCPIFREPFTYAEIVAGKHFAILEELKENKTNKNNRTRISPEIIQPTGKEFLADASNIMNREDPLDTQKYYEPRNEYVKQSREQLEVTSDKQKKPKKVPNKRDFNADSSSSQTKEDTQKINKRRASLDEKIDKQTKNRTNKNIKNLNKDRYKAKDYDRNKSTSSKDSHNNVNAEWQFKRSHAREEQRLSNEPDIPLSSNWYFVWEESRKNARKRNEEHDYDDDSPDNLYWHERKGRKFQKHERYSRESVRMTHRGNILQRRRD